MGVIGLGPCIRKAELSGCTAVSHACTSTTQMKLAIMLPFWIDCTASSLSTLLVTLAGTVSVLMSVFAAPR